MYALEAIRPSMFADITVSTVERLWLFTADIVFYSHRDRDEHTSSMIPLDHQITPHLIYFSKQLKELKTQMSQLQQMHPYLIQNLIDCAWPLLTKIQTLQVPLCINQ